MGISKLTLRTARLRPRLLELLERQVKQREAETVSAPWTPDAELLDHSSFGVGGQSNATDQDSRDLIARTGDKHEPRSQTDR